MAMLSHNCSNSIPIGRWTRPSVYGGGGEPTDECLRAINDTAVKYRSPVFMPIAWQTFMAANQVTPTTIAWLKLPLHSQWQFGKRFVYKQLFWQTWLSTDNTLKLFYYYSPKKDLDDKKVNMRIRKFSIKTTCPFHLYCRVQFLWSFLHFGFHFYWFQKVQNDSRNTNDIPIMFLQSTGLCNQN